MPDQRQQAVRLDSGRCIAPEKDRWRRARLSKVLKLVGGYAFKSTDSSTDGVPWLKIANVGLQKIDWSKKAFLPKSFLKKHKTFCLSEGDYVVALTRPILDNKLKIARLDNKDVPALLNQRVGKLQPLSGDDPEFLYYLLQSPFLVRELSLSLMGTDPPNISDDSLGKIVVNLPSLPEQRKIAEILSCWDNVIEQTENLVEAKIQLKKGLMQKLLREAEESNHTKLSMSDLFSEIKEKVGERTIIPLSITAGVGYVDQRKKWSRETAGASYEKYTLLRKGDFSYNKGNSKTFAYGCIYRLEAFEEGAVPFVFYSFRKKHPDVVEEFFKHYFHAGCLHRELNKRINAGIRNDGLLNLARKDFFSIELPLPSDVFQNLWAATFEALDREISFTKSQLKALNDQKRGLMQKLLTGNIRVKV